MPDGSTINVKRFSALSKNGPGLAEFKEMYQQMVALFVETNASIGDILVEEKGITLLRGMAGILPILGAKDGEVGIDVDALLEAGDIEQICNLFITSSMNREGKNRGKYKVDPNGNTLTYEPSDLAELNQLNFYGYIDRAIKEKDAREKATKAGMALELAKTATNGSSVELKAVEIPQ